MCKKRLVLQGYDFRLGNSFHLHYLGAGYYLMFAEGYYWPGPVWNGEGGGPIFKVKINSAFQHVHFMTFPEHIRACLVQNQRRRHLTLATYES